MDKLTEAILLLPQKTEYKIFNDEYIEIRILEKIDKFKLIENDIKIIGELTELGYVYSNGLHYLYDKRNPFKPTDEEIAIFKKDNPYAVNMKTGDVNLKPIDSSLRISRMKKYIEKELKTPNFIKFLQYLKKNYYRILKHDTIKKKIESLGIHEKALDALYELNLLACQSKWNNKRQIEFTYKITNEGKKLV